MSHNFSEPIKKAEERWENLGANESCAIHDSFRKIFYHLRITTNKNKETLRSFQNSKPEHFCEIGILKNKIKMSENLTENIERIR